MAETATTGLTWSDLQQFPDDGVKRELIGGRLFVTPSPVDRHQWTAVLVSAALLDAARVAGGRVFHALDVVLGERDVVQPDVCAFRPEHLDRIRDGYPRAAPDLVVEISSPATRRTDLGRKKDLYERHGVAEYWFVDLDADRIECYRLDAGRYGPPRLLTRDDRLGSAQLPALDVAVDTVLPAPED
ncbi:MAG TPA: Uma2 family endonuclease [Egibacteraceae bacterium]|nr:Uma2 family endonuclease [Actinomycetota bacterium]HWB71117.1 Uma2 family endonuclease [Egibacteraceae bacterium]